MQAIKFLIDPFNIFWLLLAVAFFAYFIKKMWFCRILVFTTAVWFLLISTPLIPIFLLSSLESRFVPVSVEKLDHQSLEYHIVVLGGGHGSSERLPVNSLLSDKALVRLNEGIRLHRQLPNSYLITSGYKGKTPVSQAELLRQTAILLGVLEQRIMVQEEPHNTYTEAAVYFQRFAGENPVILVTSASHMPRALMEFKSFGVEVIPSPTNYQIKETHNIQWLGLPSMRNIGYLKNAFYEYIAIFRFKFLKR